EILRFGEKAQGVDAALAADAGVLDPAKRRAQISRHPAVDPYDAHIEASRDTVRAPQIAGPQGGREAVLRFVGEADGVVLVVERNQADQRTENFLLVGGAA